MLSIWHSLGLMKNKQKSAYCLYYDCFSQLRDGMTLKIMALLHIKLYVFSLKGILPMPICNYNSKMLQELLAPFWIPPL